jgi:hypothetical protein
MHDASGQHSLDPAANGRLREPQSAANLAVGQPAIALEMEEDLPVNLVDGRLAGIRI